MIDKISSLFFEHFGDEPQIFRSPGRVNIIGEHTDYNEGFVLPAAIDRSIYVAIKARPDNMVNLFAASYNEKYECTLATVRPTEKQWPNYILGVVDQLQKRGCKLGGFNLVVDGDIPIGAGLSSSAAVECAVVFALNKIFCLDLEKMEMVKLAQKAEHKFAGVKCGIMDQFASMFGKKDHAIKLDCHSLNYEYVPLDLKGIKIVLLNTNVIHSLTTSEYNTRRQQCEQGTRWIKQKYPDVNSLRDVTLKMLNEIVFSKDALIYTRCRYVVEENIRVLEGCEALKNGDIKALGQKMFKTHEGLSKQFEVSCKELDFLVNQVRQNPFVLGARMMGGGFGGCTINLVKEEGIGNLIDEISTVYQIKTGLNLSPYIVRVEDGTSTVTV